MAAAGRRAREDNADELAEPLASLDEAALRQSRDLFYFTPFPAL